jgi:YD repeat-containing protein
LISFYKTLIRQSGRYNHSSQFRVERNADGHAYYYINNQLAYSATVDNSEKLYVDVRFIKGYQGSLEYVYTSFGNCSNVCSTSSVPTDSLNWTYVKVYDEEGNNAGETVEFKDRLGRVTQVQAKVLSKNKIVTNETIYDDFGRPAVTTKSAPLESNCFGFREEFFTNNQNNHFSYSDFTASKKDNPSTVNQDHYGTLGFYYSDNNDEYKFTPSSDYPYSMAEYTNDPESSVRKTSKPGEAFRMGSGREKESYAMPAADELESLLGTNKSFYLTGDPETHNVSQITGHNFAADKVIGIDEEGREKIEFLSSGLVIAQAFSGIGGSCPTQSVEKQVIDDLSLDIHIPASQKSSLQINTIEYEYYITPGTNIVQLLAQTDINVKFTDLQNDHVLVSGSDYSIDGSGNVTFLGDYTTGSSFLRISIEYTNSVPGERTVVEYRTTLTYSLDYTDWSLFLFDMNGRVRKKIQPNGIDCDSPGIFSFENTTVYNNLGQVVSVNSPDKGEANFLYNDIGQLRFSQNAQQVIDGQFSYTVYDDVGRVIESGIYDQDNGGHAFQDAFEIPANIGADTSVHEILNTEHGLDLSYCSEVVRYHYGDIESTEEMPSAWSHVEDYTLKNQRGRLTKVENEQLETWFGYDQRGRLSFKVDQILDTDFTNLQSDLDEQIKTFDYEYNAKGLVKNLIYQKNTDDLDTSTSEYLKHHFKYNLDNVLYQTYTAGINGNLNKQSEYQFDDLGSTIRTEIGDKIQGIDYVYTLNDQLKSINNPSLDDATDPGQDNHLGSDHAEFFSDV